MSTFWKEVVASPLRVICIIITLLCQRGLVGAVIGAFVVVVVTEFVRRSITINWRSPQTQKIANAICIFSAVWWVASCFGLTGMISMFVDIAVFAVAIIAVFVIICKR